jgi:hypothetical protein
MRKFICAAIVTVCAFSVAMAEEFMGAITKVEDGKVTLTKFGKKKGEKGEERTLTLAKGAKIFKNAEAKFSKSDDGKFKIEVTGGEEIKVADLATLVKDAEKGTFARFITEGEGANEKIKEIRTVTFKGFKGKDKDKKKAKDTN